MNDQLFTPEQISNILGCSAEALKDIPNFPALVESTNQDGDAVTGYRIEDYAAWCQSLGNASKLESRSLIGLSEAAEILGTDQAHVVQMTMRGMPRFEPLAPRAVYAGEAAVFIREEVIAYRDRCALIENMAGGSVH